MNSLIEYLRKYNQQWTQEYTEALKLSVLSLDMILNKPGDLTYDTYNRNRRQLAFNLINKTNTFEYWKVYQAL